MHLALDDIIKRALRKAGLDTIHEPGIIRGDGKHPDGVSLPLFLDGKNLVGIAIA